MKIDYRTQVAYQSELELVLTRFEGYGVKPYLDTKDIVTIGVGINLKIPENRNNVLNLMSVFENDLRRLDLDAYRSAKQVGKPPATTEWE